MADILSIVSLVSFIVAGISLVVAIFFWINFKIPRVIGDLTGRTARKSIAKMRASNEASGSKSYRPSATNVNRGKLTDTMPDSVKLNQQASTSAPFDKGQTGILDENKVSGNSAEPTAMLDDSATELLLGSEETELLAQEAQAKRKVAKKKLRMLDEVIYTHTDEVI